MVWGSRKSRRLRASATTMADRPSGAKYMLYGSSTATGRPGFPVVGSMGVRLPSVRPSALLVTQSVLRSHEGTTCWGLTPTLNRSITFMVAGSITYTSFALTLGTYTRWRAPAVAGASFPGPVSLYRLAGSTTGGIPGTVLTAPAGCPVAGPCHPSPATMEMARSALRTAPQRGSRCDGS